MSGTTFNYQLVESLYQAQAQAAAGASNGGGLTFPYYNPTNDPDTQWCTGTSFDDSIPYNSDGSINVAAMLQKLHDILYYSANGDQMNYNSIMDATAYLMNIGGVWGSLSSAQQSQVSQYLNLSVSGTSIIDLVAQDGIPAVIYGTFFNSNRDQAGTLAFASSLLSELNAIAGANPELSPLAQVANSLIGQNGSTLQNWMTTQNIQNPNETFDGFAFSQALNWESDFSYNVGTADFFNSWRSLELNDTMNQDGVKGNPFLEYIMIMYILMNENGDEQTTIAGQGNLTNYLSNPMGSNGKDLANEWSAGNFNATSAQAFYNQIIELAGLSKNAAVGSIASQITAVFQAMTNPNATTSIQSTFTFDGKTVTMSLAQVFTAIQSGTMQWSDMANALNGLQPSATPVNNNSNVPSFQTPPGYTTLSNMLQQITNSITSQSSAVGQIMQNDEGVNEKDLSMIQACAEEIVNPEKQIAQNMAQAGA